MPNLKMRRLSRRASAAVLAAALALAGLVLALRHHLPGPAVQAVRLWWYGVSVDTTQQVIARDGTVLRGTLYLPQRQPKPWATVLIRLPYGRHHYGEALGAATYFARHGYAVLVQDVRGKGASGGKFLPWAHASQDGADTLDWLARQPWSNQKVGSWGCSALGELQYALARARHPAHAAMLPMGAGGGAGSVGGLHGYFGVFEGGVFQLASAFGWMLKHGMERPDAPPLTEPVNWPNALRATPLQDMVKRLRPGPNAWDHFTQVPLDDPRWGALDYVAENDRLATPTLDINTWGDQTLDGTLALADHARRTAPGKPHHVVIAPGDHCVHDQAASHWGELPLKLPARDWYGLYLRWFDLHLRGKPWQGAPLPRYEYYMLGEDLWLQAQQWPPEQTTPLTWYLDSDGGAQGAAGNGRLLRAPAATPAVDTLEHNPQQPVPTVGGPLCCTGNPADRSGPADQTAVEARSDVLVFTSEPLTDNLRLAGPVQLEVQVEGNGPAANLVARLTMVAPSGQSTSLQEGALRLNFRQDANRTLVGPAGQTALAQVSLRSMALRVPSGYRLRLHVAASSFPRLERFPLLTASLRIHLGGSHPAKLTLHALPGTRAQPVR